MSQTQQQDCNNHPASHPEPRSLAERISFGSACLILLSVVGLVGYLWAKQEHRQPPEIAVEPGTMWESKGQFYVPFRVSNTGGGTAASVQIIAELRLNGQVAESGEQQIDFLSGGETETGAFVFSQDPESGELSIRAASYQLP